MPENRDDPNPVRHDYVAALPRDLKSHLFEIANRVKVRNSRDLTQG